MRIPAENGHAPAAGREGWILCLAVLACLLPFLNKAVHIDDPLYIWPAQWILSNPIDFYGFEANWNGVPLPMYESSMNPPLLSFFLAPVGALLGWSEPVLHGVMLIPALALAWGTWQLAREFTERPMVAAMVAVLTPGFVVSASSIMCDVTMMALWVWACVFWVRGLKEQRCWKLAAGAALAGFAIFAKYFAFSLIPLLAWWTLARNPRGWKPLLFLLIPLGMLAGYEAWTASVSGMGHFWRAVGFAGGIHEETEEAHLAKLLTGISFAGGCAGIALLAMDAWLKPLRLAWAAGAGVLLYGVIYLFPDIGWFPFSEESVLPGFAEPQLAFWIACGGRWLWQLGEDVQARRSAESLVLAAWVVGTLVFACFLNHYVNGRVILPLVPALAMVAARYLDREGGQAAKGGWRMGATVAGPAAALALVVASADASLANSARTAARDITRNYPPERLWLTGHWGFQYYLEEAGAKSVDLSQPGLPVGDILVTPGNNTQTRYVSPDDVHAASPQLQAKEIIVSYNMLGWGTTMHIELGAGFHSDAWGPLPFVFGPVPAEEYSLLAITPR